MCWFDTFILYYDYHQESYLVSLSCDLMIISFFVVETIKIQSLILPFILNHSRSE